MSKDTTIDIQIIEIENAIDEKDLYRKVYDFAKKSFKRSRCIFRKIISL